MAKVVFAGSAGFHYHAEVRRLLIPAGRSSLAVSTIWVEASPHVGRRVFQVSTDAAGLGELARLIQGTLA